MLGKIFNTFFPMREFLNYLFKKTLGDYILNDLDLNKIEIEISNKAFISLKNIDLNAADINKKHFENFPFLMLEGQIKKFDLSFSLDKISINIDKLNILLMPIFNKEKTKNLISKKQIPVKVNEFANNNVNYSTQKDYASYSKENTSNEFSLVSSFLNSALSNLEINITNISISILSYEASNTYQDNPILTFFISEICFRKKNEDDLILVKENKNFQTLNISNANPNKFNSNISRCTKNFNNTNNENIRNNNLNKTDKNLDENNTSNRNDFSNSAEINNANNNNNPNNSSNQNNLTFLSNKILLIDKIILRIHQQNQNIENEFFEMTNENQEKINFNFFCDNSSILVFDYKSTGYSVMVDFAERFDNKNKYNESSCNLMDINIDLRKLEICINPLQMQILINYFDVFNMISLLKKKDFKEFSYTIKNNNSQINNIKLLEPIKILKTIISKFSVNFFFEGLNIIILETNYMKDIPKLWSFFQTNYNKKIENIYALESHYSYLEDNFFLVNLDKLKFNFTQDFILNKENLEFTLEKVYLKYIEFLGKKKIIPSNNITHCKLTFSNNNPTNFMGKSSLFSESIYSNNINNSKVLFNSQLQKSKNFFNNNNNNSKINLNLTNQNQANLNSNIHASNVYYMENKSMNRSSCSIYESVRDYDEAYNSDNSIIKNSLNNTMYQSTLESKDALLERYNLIFESEYLHESHAILEITNNSISDNYCFLIKSFKDYFVLKKNHMNNSYTQLLKEESLLAINNNNDSDAVKNFPTNFADYFKQYTEIIFKKINVEFNPLYMFKVTKLILNTQMILNEFLYLIDNDNKNNSDSINDKNELKKAKSFKSESNLSSTKNRKASDYSESFIDKSVIKEDCEENLDAKYFNDQENFDKNESRNKSSKSFYFKGCYDKSKQILVCFEEINLRIKTLKKDFYDIKGNCVTNTNSNLNEEFKKYEEFSSLLQNSKFLSEFIINYFKENVNPFISSYEKNEFNKSLIGKKQEIKQDKQMNIYKINKDYLELNLSNHKILLNFKNEKIDKITNYNNNSSVINNNENQLTESFSYLNSLNKILYDFDSIHINFGSYNILKLKRDMIGLKNINNNDDNSNQRKVFEFENSFCEKNEKRNSVYKSKNTNDVEQMTSKNNLHFRLSQIVINQKQTYYPQDSNEEEINLAFKNEFFKAEEKINNKIEGLFNLHNLNLIKNFEFNNSNNLNENNQDDNIKEIEDLNTIQCKKIEKIEFNVNFTEDIYLTFEPQIIMKILPFFESLLFSLNIQKLLANKQKEIYDFYKDIYFVSLNIDNFNDFGFYFKNKKEKEVELEQAKLSDDNNDDEVTNTNSNNELFNEIKFSVVSLLFKNINLLILKNNTDDYIDLLYKSCQYTNYLVKVSLLNPFVNIIAKGIDDSNILVSINDLKIATFKNKEIYFSNPIFSSPLSLYSFTELDKEIEKDNVFIKEISYDENLLLYKGDTLYQNISKLYMNNFSNKKADPEKDLEKYFKSNKQKNILTLAIKSKKATKNNFFNNLKKQKSSRSLDYFNEEDKVKETNIRENAIEISKNFDLLIQNNLIPQTDTSLDIIIISNDAVLSPLVYPNFKVEEIKLIAKEFGFEIKGLPNSNNEINKDKLNDLLLQTIKSEQGFFSIKDYDKSELKLSIRDSSKMELNLEKNLQNFLKNENEINKDNSEKDFDNKIKFDKEQNLKDKKIKEDENNKYMQKNQKFVNLFAQSSLNIDFNIEINRFSIDAFIDEDFVLEKSINETNNNYNNNSQSASSIYQRDDKTKSERNKRKKKIRLIIQIEKIAHFKEIEFFSNNNSNVSKRNLIINNLSVFLLKNLDHPYAEMNILKLNNGRFHENSIFKYLGFIELLNLNFINLSFSNEIAFEFFADSAESSDKKEKSEILLPKIFNDIAIKIEDISIFLCKDTLDACLEIADALKERVNILKDLFNDNQSKCERNSSNTLIDELNDKGTKTDSIKDKKIMENYSEKNKCDESISRIPDKIEMKLEENITQNSNIIQVSEENYFEKNNLKNLIFLEDYCSSNSKSLAKDIDSEYEKLGYSLKNYINNPNDINSFCDKRISFDSKSNNKERKEETIILFDLESLKLYIYKGNDFNFLEEKASDRLSEAKVKKTKDSSKEKYLNNDEILMIFSNSLYDDNNKNEHNKKETRETFNFIYDKQNNSIKLDDNIIDRKSLYCAKRINNLDHENHEMINKNKIEINNDCNYRNKNILNNSHNIDNNLNSNASIYSKANSDYYNKSMNEKISFNIIEKFYFCNNENKRIRSNSLNENNCNKNELNYLEFEKKLARKKQNQRDYNNHICINLEFLKTKFDFYRNNEKISINVFINKFDIDDYVHNSKYKKIISKYVLENFDNAEIYENSKNSKKINKYKYKEDRPLLDFDIDIVKINESFLFDPLQKSKCEASQAGSTSNFNNERKIRKNSDYKIEENVLIAINKEDNVDNIEILDLKNKNKKLENDLIHIDGFISPINILLDQATLVFIIEFFLAKDNNNLNNRNEYAKSNSYLNSDIQRKNLDYKKIKDPLEINVQVKKLKSIDKETKQKQNIKLKESIEQGNLVNFIYF